MAASKAFKRLKATIETGTIDKSFVRAMKKFCNAVARREQGYSTSQTSPNGDGAEVAILQNMLHLRHPKVSDELTQQGWQWLGTRKVMKELGQRERAIILNFSHYTLAGFYPIYNGSFLADHAPLWVVHAKDGSAFEYWNGSWQSGHGVNIVG